MLHLRELLRVRAEFFGQQAPLGYVLFGDVFAERAQVRQLDTVLLEQAIDFLHALDLAVAARHVIFEAALLPSLAHFHAGWCPIGRVV